MSFLRRGVGGAPCGSREGLLLQVATCCCSTSPTLLDAIVHCNFLVMPNTALQHRSLQHFSQHFPRRLLNNSPNIFSTILFKHLFLGPALTTLLPLSFPSQEGESDSTPHLAPHLLKLRYICPQSTRFTCHQRL